VNLTWASTTWQRTAMSGYGANGELTPTVTPQTRWSSSTVDHGLKDGKGRAIGTFAIIDAFRPLVLVEKDGRMQSVEIEGTNGLRQLQEETAFFVTTQTTRDGHMFGAISVGGTKCKTLEEAQALAAKKIAAAGKRFARQVAKGEGRQFTKVSP
jgi:hypothetical protein